MVSKPSVEEIRNAQRANGPATILAIGTANPTNEMYQVECPDFYFRVTKSEHKTNLKNKFKRICDKSMIRKRHIHLTEELLNENPHLFDHNVSSLDTRQDILVVEVPKLGKEAAVKAIKEWGQPRSMITHVIFCTASCVDLPGADYQLAKLLGLDQFVKRFMLYQQGCYAGGTVLRLAKDIAENNRGSRVLVVCSEITVIGFHGPTELYWESMIGQALFGDGDGALIVGADPNESIEQPIFQLVWAAQSFLPNSEGAIGGRLGEVGLSFHILKDVLDLISKNIEKELDKAFKPIGVDDWNSLF